MKLLFIQIILLLSLSNQANDIFPEDTWQEDEYQNYFKEKEFKSFVDFTFKKNKIQHTESLIIVKNGKIVFEKYGPNYNEEQLHLAWSMTKTFAGVIFGIAQDLNIINKEDYLSKYWPDILHGEDHVYKSQLQLKHFLTMSSGLDFLEDYLLQMKKSDVIKMLYLEGNSDMGSFTISHKSKYKPGTRFYYSSGDTNLLMSLLKDVMRESNYDYNTFAWEHLFNKIGMKNVVWEQDPSGTFVGSSYIYATPRDYARFGLLLIRDGWWKNTQVISKEWLDYMKTLNTAFTGGEKPYPKKSYGAHLWLNRKIPEVDIKKQLEAAPESTFMALGHAGQFIIMIPEYDLVIVRNGQDNYWGINKDKMITLLLKSFKKD